jgi:AraC family ethanolamine operon transcriptional activator
MGTSQGGRCLKISGTGKLAVSILDPLSTLRTGAFEDPTFMPMEFPAFGDRENGALRFSSGHYEDIDAQAARLEGYGQRYQQLSRGHFRGWFASYEFGPHFGIHLEGTNRELAQSGSTPTGHITLCFVAENSSPCIVDGTPVAPDDVAFWPSEHEFEARTTERMKICVLDISAAVSAPLASLSGRVGMVSDARIAAILRRYVRAGIRELGGLETGPHPAAVAAFTATFVDVIAALMAPLGFADPRSSLARSCRVDMFRRARDLIQRRLGDGVGVEDICSNVGAGRRTLEYLFQSMVGMGPARYIRVLQLNQIRREIAAGTLTEPLGDLAARWGVWHWSRFSREYCQTFGELPSATRARALR